MWTNVQPFWWLRSPGYDSNSAAYVNFEGMFDSVNVYQETSIYSIHVGVRPALWLNL